MVEFLQSGKMLLYREVYIPIYREIIRFRILIGRIMRILSVH